MVFILISAWLALRQAYWWQVKEYRWDRWWTWVRYNGGWRELGLGGFRRPKATFRVMMMGLVWGVLGWRGASWWGWLAAAYAGPALGVALTAPVNRLARGWWRMLAARRMAQVKPKVIGITGSYGKTTSKEMLAYLLEKKFRVVKTLKNENTEIGIARRILRAVVPGTEVLVMEVGAYRRGEIARVVQMAPVDIAWVTAIGNQHVGLFGSHENLRKTKFELVEGLKPGGTAVFNRAQGEEEVVEWAKRRGIKEVVYEARGRESNEKGAAAVAKLLGMEEGEINRGLEEFKNQFPWPKVVQTPRGVTVVDESYNANQQGFEEAVKYVGENFSGRKYLVTPGIIELGEETGAVHRQLAKSLAGWDGVWVTNGKMAQYLNGVKEEDPAKLLGMMRSTLTKGDVVLIVSRIHSKLKAGILQI